MMAEEGFKRKLTDILSADVVGYSRLMDDNEEATIRTLNAYRASMTTLIINFTEVKIIINIHIFWVKLCLLARKSGHMTWPFYGAFLNLSAPG
ncbi:MAG: hypothetical protein KJP23_09620 [Deltaproteobacteria bacterium]|nr:hypothetical protein [Deltaproteobacteria bacterium]